MKRKWDSDKAISCLNKAGLEVDDLRKVVIGKGVNGLKACSAIDYLVNHNKYRVLLIRNLF